MSVLRLLRLWSFGGTRGKYRRRAATNLTKRTGGDGGDPGGPQTPHFVDTRYHGYWSLAFDSWTFSARNKYQAIVVAFICNRVEVTGSGPRKSHTG